MTRKQGFEGLLLFLGVGAELLQVAMQLGVVLCPAVVPVPLDLAWHGDVRLVRGSCRDESCVLRGAVCDHRQSMVPLAYPEQLLRKSDPVVQATDAIRTCTVGAAIDSPIVLGAVTDHPALAVRTPGSHGVDRAFEGVKGAGSAIRHGQLERLVVIVVANVAGRHGHSLQGGVQHRAPHGKGE